MTKQNKIQKLYNVIIEYRGRYDSKTLKWIYPPNVRAMSRLVKWLISLNIDSEKALEEIDDFKSFEEFRDWIKAVPLTKTLLK